MKDRRERRRIWLTGGIVCSASFSVVLVLVLLQVLGGAGRPVSAGERAYARPASVDREPRAAGARSQSGDSQGWHVVFSETFDSDIGPTWTVTGAGAASGGPYVWGTSTYTYVSEGRSAWSAGGGGEPGGLYTDSMDTWLVSDPIELGGLSSKVWDAEVEFAWWLDAALGVGALGAQSIQRVNAPPPSGDWFGWGVLTDVADLESGHWSYVSGATMRWMRGSIPLDDFLPAAEGTTSTVRIGFHFVSDGDGAVGRGAFVDDVTLRANRGHDVALPLLMREPPVEPTPPPTATSILTNGSFEDGWTDMETGQQPVHWEWHWTEGEMFPGSTFGTVLPETNVKAKDQIPPHEHNLFFRDGWYCVKVFGPGNPGQPIHAVLSQRVTDLEVGRQYRFTAPMYVDVYSWDGEKVPPGDPWAAEVRLGVLSGDATWPDGVVDSSEPPWNGSNTADFFLSKHDFSFDFTASESEMKVYVEVWAKWADLTNGFFLDDLKLVPLP